MRCTSCSSENPDSRRFCGDCGSPLGSRCARYGVENPAGKKFWGDSTDSDFTGTFVLPLLFGLAF